VSQINCCKASQTAAVSKKVAHRSRRSAHKFWCNLHELFWLFVNRLCARRPLAIKLNGYSAKDLWSTGNASEEGFEDGLCGRMKSASHIVQRRRSNMKRWNQLCLLCSRRPGWRKLRKLPEGGPISAIARGWIWNNCIHLFVFELYCGLLFPPSSSSSTTTDV